MLVVPSTPLAPYTSLLAVTSLDTMTITRTSMELTPRLVVGHSVPLLPGVCLLAEACVRCLVLHSKVLLAVVALPLLDALTLMLLQLTWQGRSVSRRAACKIVSQESRITIAMP